MRRATSLAVAGALGLAVPSVALAQPHVEASTWHRGYLSRPLVPSARFLDHGVIGAAVAGGTPHLYRVEASIGLFDHLTLGATGHWLPNQRTPRWSPRVAIAFWRWQHAAIGAHYHASLFPPPVVDLSTSTLSFQRSAHWILGTMSFGQRLVSGGFDAGVVRARRSDPAMDPGPDLRNPSRIVWEFGGGAFLRVGTRRWGITAQALIPQVTAEIVLDVRFGAFEARPRGGWWPSERVRWMHPNAAR